MSILIVSNLDRSHRSICTLSGRPRLTGKSLLLSFCKLLQNYILCIIIIATLKARKGRVHLFIKNRYLSSKWFFFKFYSNATVMIIVMNRFTKPLHGVWRVSWKINIVFYISFVSGLINPEETRDNSRVRSNARANNTVLPIVETLQI